MRKNGVEHHRPSAVERGLGAVERGCHAMAVAYIHRVSYMGYWAAYLLMGFFQYFG
jgi:hypothetical protein